MFVFPLSQSPPLLIPDANSTAKAMLAYQSAAIGSRLFSTRLIELASRAIHQIAIEIALLDENFHKTDAWLSWIPPKSDELFWRWEPERPPPTWFYISWYSHYKQYPCAENDMIGYWAENYIIGGVLLFDRRNPESPPQNNLAGNIDVSHQQSTTAACSSQTNLLNNAFYSQAVCTFIPSEI